MTTDKSKCRMPADTPDRAARADAVALALVDARQRVQEARARIPELRRQTAEQLVLAKAKIAAKRLNST